jgi:hypothetical protein
LGKPILRKSRKISNSLLKEFKNYESPNEAIENNKKKLKRQSSISMLSQGKSLKLPMNTI